jgi:hypothetical protein
LGGLEETVLSHDDGRAQYERAMGADLGQRCYLLRDDFDWLRRKWSERTELFEKGEKRIELLNATASNFFYFLNRVFFEDAMLHLCRLTDRETERDRESLTVMTLANLISDTALKGSVEVKAEAARKDCDFARKWRNRRLAHTDLLSLRQGHAVTLPEVNSTDVDNAMSSIGCLLALVDDHYRLPHTLLGPDPWGAKSLVHYLERGERAIEDERQRWINLGQDPATNG